tara:strand:- start:466 stop:1728 length:1263 start_codon:yes stop_codon:yes gene_type:complete
MNNPALEAFIEKVDREETEDSKETKDSKDLKETKDSKATNSIADTAKSMKQTLEEGLKEIDDLDPVERSCGLLALQKKMKLGKDAFAKLVDNLVRMTEEQPPKTFKALLEYSKDVKPMIPDLLGVGLTLIAAEGYAGKSAFCYEIVEAVTNGGVLFNQFEVKEANGLIIQLDETYADYAVKQRIMNLQFKEKNWEIWWNFTPLEFPELKKYVIENNTKVIMMDSCLKIAGVSSNPKDAEFGLLIYRLNQLAGELGISIILIHHLNKKEGRKTVVKEEIYGTAFIFNGSADVWGFWIEQGAKGLVANLKILKSRSMVVDINEQYRFTQCPETKRHIYLDRANGTATLNELNTNKDRVLNLLKDSPFTLFSAADVNRILNLGNVNYARNILLKLYVARCGVDRVEGDVSKGRPPYLYRWNVK